MIATDAMCKFQVVNGSAKRKGSSPCSRSSTTLVVCAGNFRSRREDKCHGLRVAEVIVSETGVEWQLLWGR